MRPALPSAQMSLSTDLHVIGMMTAYIHPALVHQERLTFELKSSRKAKDLQTC